ncbi:MAG: GntR family transcriptional regulator [Anaerolineae bacterium]
MVTDKSPLNQIDNKPLRERIADVLRESILTATLKPGQTIVEATIAEQLGVSRAPIREALQILNTEGLIEVIPYHKTTVRRLTREDIEELYSLRSSLESFAGKRIIANAPPADLTLLRVCCDEMLQAAKTNDAQQVSHYDHQFHDTLITLSHHKLLISMWNTVSQRVKQVLALRDMRRKDLQEMALSHVPIIDAVEAKNLELATELIDNHIMTASDFIVDVWDEDAYGEPHSNDSNK